MRNDNALSKNEYLIVLTHLLKMIKRQSETDLAQLMSFTYQHKLSCYSSSCICQFFTQYCQDPEQFKRKKKRIYRGYKDDGQKLVQLDRATSLKEAMEEQMHLNSQVDEMSCQNYQTSNSQGNGIGESSYVYEDQQILNSDTNLPSIGIGLEYVQGGSTSIVLRPNLITQFNTDANTRQTLVDREEHLASTRQYMNPLQQNNEINNLMSMDEASSQIHAVEEPAIMGMFHKGSILRGAAYNGFDTNMDFKIKGEFKSPSQFKTVYESRTYFLTRLLETMFKQLESKTGKNMSFILISIFFQYAYQHNIYQAVLAMVKYSQTQRRSSLQRLQFSVTEFYMLEKILDEFKVANSKENVNYASFIESNQMQQNLDWLFEETSNDVLQFWKIFQEEEANVRRAYVLGMSISKNVSKIKDYTIQLEELQMIKDYNKYYYYAMFYQNILNDKQNYNSMINNLRNLLMVRNMRKKNSRFGNGTNDVIDIGFAILSFEDDRTVGKFKYANRVICQLLNTSEDSILEKSVKYLMPELIFENHHQFIKRFLAEGLPRFLGRVRTLFIKDFQGYIKPVQFYLNFHYNSKFSYSLVLHIDPIQNFNFQNAQAIPMKNVFAIIADVHNNIRDVSYNCKVHLGLSRKQLSTQQELIGRCLKVDDIIHKMAKLDQYLIENPGAVLTNQIVKVRSFKNSQQNYVSCSLQFEEVIYLNKTANEFKEKVFIFIPLSKIPEFENSSMLSGSGHLTQIQQNQTSKDDNFLQNWASSELTNSNDQGLQSQEDKFMSASQSCSSQSNSSANSSSSLSYTKGLLFSNRSPKILRIYLYIVFCLLFSFISVSSINFIIYSQKKNQVDLQIQFNSLINKRNTFLVHSLSSLKQLHLIATLNSTPSNNLSRSSIFTSTDRFTYYLNQLNSSSLQLLDLHESFQSLSQRNPSISSNLNRNQFEKVKFDYLSNSYQIYSVSNSFDYGLSLLVSNIGLITGQDILREKIPLNIYQIISSASQAGSKNQSVSASNALRNMYYVYDNGLNQLNYLGQIQEANVQENSQETSTESKLYINLMSFISIGAITLIGVMTFPLLGKIEDRKISVLKFFNLLSIKQIELQIERCQEFQTEFTMLSKDVNQNKDNKSESQQSDDENDSDSDEILEENNSKRISNSSQYPRSSKINFSVPDLKLPYQEAQKYFQSIKENGINKQTISEKKMIQVKRSSQLNSDLIDEGIIEELDSQQSSVSSQKNEMQTIDPEVNHQNKNSLGESHSNVNFNSFKDYSLSISQQPQQPNLQYIEKIEEHFSIEKNQSNFDQEKHRVKFAPEESQKQQDKLVVKSEEVGFGFQPTKKQKKRKSKLADRKNSDAFYTSAFDIQKILGKISMNEMKQHELKNQRRQEREELMLIQGKRSRKRIVQMRASQNEEDFDGIRGDKRKRRLKEVFEIKGAQGRGKDIMKIRADEESKESQANNLAKRKIGRGFSKGNLKSQIKMNPLDIDQPENTKKRLHQFASSKWKIAKMHVQKDQEINRKHQEEDSESDSSISEEQRRRKNIGSQKEKKKIYNIKDLLSFKKATTRSEMIQELLDKIALKEKMKLALYVLAVILFLNSNLIASYYIGKKTFEEDSAAIQKLATFYHKENYVGNLLLYTQEEFIQNKSIANNQGSIITSSYLLLTNQNENDYNDIRRSYPDFLTSVQTSLQQIESSLMCNQVFGENSTKLQSCEQAYNQILQKGLTQTIYTIYTYMQTLQVNFEKNNRTANYLKEVQSDQRFRDITDLYNEYLRDIFSFMSSEVTSATIEYFDSLSQSYLIVFAAYLGAAVLMCFVFGFYVFKKLRQQIMTSINILAIIPLEDLDVRDRSKIEEFLNQ